MATLHPPLEPNAAGMLDVGQGQLIHWEECGDPAGKPAVCLHGGPGSGCTPGWRRHFDPRAYRVVLFDQRGCGRSLPNAADPGVDLAATNTTARLVADIERLRRHLGIERWLVLGGSWGSTLALAYAETHPERVTEMVLFSVVTTSRREVEWITRDVGRIFPEQWTRFRDAVPEPDRDGNLAEAYRRLLADPDAGVRAGAAAAWCAWEDVHVDLGGTRGPSPRFQDPAFRLCFARLVTHYWAHAAFLEDGALLRDAGRLGGIPGVLVHSRFDVSSPLDVPWQLSRAWPGSRLVVVDDPGHGSGAATNAAIVTALARFAGV
jgi:proline iminopeptidase